MSNVKIKKATIKQDLFLYVEFSEELEGHKSKETKLTCDIPVHQDMKEAFADLNKHLALVSGLVPFKGKDLSHFSEESVMEFSVQGFTNGGSGEHEGITLTGKMEGPYGLLNLNTPFQNNETSNYPFMGELNQVIGRCIVEVEEYLFAGKRAPETQMEFDFEDEGVAEEPEPKSKRKPKTEE